MRVLPLWASLPPLRLATPTQVAGAVKVVPATAPEHLDELPCQRIWAVLVRLRFLPTKTHRRLRSKSPSHSFNLGGVAGPQTQMERCLAQQWPRIGYRQVTLALPVASAMVLMPADAIAAPTKTYFHCVDLHDPAYWSPSHAPHTDLDNPCRVLDS